jgi:type II secretion system protein I
MIVSRRAAARPGLSLLEVLIALAVFLISYIAIWQLMSMAGDRALELTNRNRATQLAQAKLDEVIAGALPLSSQGDTGFEDEYNAPDFTYQVDVNDGAVSSLHVVTVTVTRVTPTGTVKVQVTQMLVDPAQTGSTQDVQPLAGTSQSSSGSGSTGGTGTTGN